MGHGTCRLASSQHQGAATRHLGQAIGHVQQRLCTSDCSIEQLAQKLSRILMK
jgi:hypothetical protein